LTATSTVDDVENHGGQVRATSCFRDAVNSTVINDVDHLKPS
jgi:hypothetical protein